MLAQFGIEAERVRLDWVSASEGDRFASIVNEMTEQVRKLGPFSVDGSGAKDQIETATVPGKVRVS
jgi:F420-non-reducing hydrogenase iron-sulfur subunit